MNTSISQIIVAEEARLTDCKSPSNGLNVLYNLIILKNRTKYNIDNYCDFKRFIEFYFEVVKGSAYGYDKLNHSKIEKLLMFLSYEEQISALKYAISVSSRELPEHDRDWFIERKHHAEIHHIFSTKTYKQYPRALFLYSATSLSKLILTLVLFFFAASFFLLPAPSWSARLFLVKYDYYSDVFILNHLLNILSHFAGIENEFAILPTNWLGVLILIAGKITFLIIVVNFIYSKISDKLNIK